MAQQINLTLFFGAVVLTKKARSARQERLGWGFRRSRKDIIWGRENGREEKEREKQERERERERGRRGRERERER